MSRRTPPGRSGRLLLRERLSMSERAGDLLHQKEEALRREHARLQGHASRARSAWEQACAELDRSVARVRLLGGADELRDVAAGPGVDGGAQVSYRWQTHMGVDYPGEVAVEPGSAPRVGATAAFGPAIASARAALVAAAEHAAAELAFERMELELAETRRRRRALTKRLIPRLQAELDQVEIDLDESEREEATRTRLAIDRREEPS